MEILKGVHPGLFLKHELSEKNISGKLLAESIGEHPQTISAIICGRRSMNTALSLQIERFLGIEEGTLMMLQVYFDIQQEKNKNKAEMHPDLSQFSSSVFWDLDIEKIDWNQHKNFVIRRIFGYGNENEIKEIIRFYGENDVAKVIDSCSNDKFLPHLKANRKQYLNYV
ncbi:MAG: plasmid maintenance system antidote protein [Bacteroidales bacterium]|nr:plasmid maintenance system antidote protein [Bacteroidales bacterium]